MSDQSSQHLSYWIMVGIVLGAVLGWFLPGVLLQINFIGTLFLNALSIVVFPLIVTTVIVGITSLGDYTKLGRTTLKTLGFIAATSGIAAAIGLALALIIGPGRGVTLSSTPLPIEVMPAQLRAFGDFLTSLIPRSLVEIADSGNYIGLVVVSILAGIVLTTRNVRGRTLLSFFKDLRDLLLKLLSWVMMVAPLGLGMLVGSVVARNRNSLTELAEGSSLLLLVAVVGLILHGVFVLPTVLRLYGLRSPVEYLGNMLPALWTAFGTSSSSATFPATYDAVVERNQVDERAGSYVLPLSMTLNMNGSALYLALAAVFVAQTAGLSLSVLQIVQLFIGAVLVSMALGGVPNAALWGVVAVASIADFPREAMAAFSALLVIDWILDRLRTVVNVTGDGVAAAVIAETFEFKTVGQRGARAAGARTRPVRRSDDRPDRGAPDVRTDRRAGRGRDRDRGPAAAGGRRPDRVAQETRRPESPAPNDRVPTERTSSAPPDREDRRQRRRPDRKFDESSRDARRGRDDANGRRSDRGPREDTRRNLPLGAERGRVDRSRPEPGARTDTQRRSSPVTDSAERSDRDRPSLESRGSQDILPIASRLTPVPSADSDSLVGSTPEPVETAQTPLVKRRVLPAQPKNQKDSTGGHAVGEIAPAEQVVDRAAPERGETPEQPAQESRTPDSSESLTPESGERESDEQPDDRPVTYGRSLSRKGKAAPPSKSTEPEVGPVSTGETEEVAVPEDSYTSDNISFGRGKRKRVR